MNLFSTIAYLSGYRTQLVVTTLYSAVYHPWVGGPFQKSKRPGYHTFQHKPLMVQEYSFSGMAPVLLQPKKLSWKGPDTYVF